MIKKYVCKKCKNEFVEIEHSHTVPVYICEGMTKSDMKNRADKFGRTSLCSDCHDVYERILLRKFYFMCFNKEIITNDPDRRSLIPYMSRIKSAPLRKKQECQDFALNFREEWLNVK